MLSRIISPMTGRKCYRIFKMLQDFNPFWPKSAFNIDRFEESN